MTTVPEYQAKIDKDVVNMDRYNAFINGPVPGTVTVDSGTFKNLPTLARDAQVSVDGAADSAAAAAASSNYLRTGLEGVFATFIGLPGGGNPNRIVVTGGPNVTDGQNVSVLVTQTNTGATTLVYGNQDHPITVNAGTGAPTAGGDLVAGKIATLQYSQASGVWILLGTRNAINTDDAFASRKLVESTYGLPLALPVDGNVNRLGYNDGGAVPADGAFFEVIIAAANTGPVALTVNGLTRGIVNPGSASSLSAGQIVGGTIIRLSRSIAGGDLYYLYGSRPLAVAGPPVGSQDSDLFGRPWGNVVNTGSGSTVTPIVKPILIIGSSNADSGYVAAGSRPHELIPAAANDAYVGIGINFTGEEQAVAGTAWDSAGAQLQASSAFLAGNVKYVFPYFWMNDARSVHYHDFGGVMLELNAIAGVIDYIRSMGAEPVLSTGFHPDPRAHPESAQVNKALDPFYFTDTASGGGSSRAMVYPVNKASPVSPTADMVPAATLADFMVQRDWSGSGIVRTGYKRVWHVNRGIRQIAAARGCMLLDNEVSTYRLCIETVPDLGAGLETFYDSTGDGNPLHPKALMYQQGVKPPIVQWARHIAAGRDDQRVFTGV